ncbi:hypothetical protein MRX96_047993 [Rhipicephalus microplus]
MHGAGIEEFVRPSTSPTTGGHHHIRRYAPVPWILMCNSAGNGAVEGRGSVATTHLLEVHSKCNTGAVQEQLQQPPLPPPPPLPAGGMKWVKNNCGQRKFGSLQIKVLIKYAKSAAHASSLSEPVSSTSQRIWAILSRDYGVLP